MAQGIGDRRGHGDPGAGRAAAPGGRLHAAASSTRSATTCSPTPSSSSRPCRTPRSTWTRATRTGSSDPRRMVEPLKRAGIAKADGFALNVSNFQTTEENTDVRQAAVRDGRRQALRHRHQPQRQRPGYTAGRPEGAGATRRAAPWASRRPPTRATPWSTPICGSSGRASRTAPARAARRRASGGRSTPSAWPVDADVTICGPARARPGRIDPTRSSRITTPSARAPSPTRLRRRPLGRPSRTACTTPTAPATGPSAPSP